MSDPTSPSAPTPNPGGRRQRAPTITIDTSAVNSPNPPAQTHTDSGSLGPTPHPPPTLQVDTSDSSNRDTSSSSSRPAHSRQGSKVSIGEHRAPSFESRDSRPTSPHNVSSPTSGWGDNSFLAVPGLRSRQNSVGSDDASHSHSAQTSYSGETFARSPSSQGDRDQEIHRGPGNEDIRTDPEALTPDPGTEQDFEVDNNIFAFSPGQLNKLLNPKSLSAFYKLGGLAGLEKGLRSDRRTGLSVDETTLDGTVSFEDATTAPSKGKPASAENGNPKAPITATVSHASSSPRQAEADGYADRKRVYGDNRLPEKKGKSFLELMWITYNDKVLILLSIAAAISLAVGLYQTFGTKHDAEHPPVEWVEGVAIIIAILVVVFVGSLNDYQKERQFVKLNKKKQDRDVNVTRSGKTRKISVFDVLVGDIMHLEPGDMIPVDGIFIEGHNVKCDESQSTGESDLIRKKPADEVFAAIENDEDLKKMDPFILSGAQVTEGVGTFLVTSTGVNSSYGKTMMSLREDPEVTPLQSKLNTLAEYIAKLGGAAGLLLFVVLFIEFLVRLPHNHNAPAEKGQEFLNIFIVTVTIIVVAVPEGLPLAVTLALAFATTRMLRDNNLVRHLKACEVMGNATTICSDKTGTLTQNKMQVVAGTVGTSSRFGGTGHATPPAKTDPSTKGKQPEPQDLAANISPSEVVTSFSPSVKSLLLQSIAVNSTAFEGIVDGESTFIGSKTETALLIFARDFLAMESVDQERSNAQITQLIPFDSGRKCMGVVVQLDNGKYRLYVKGASEIVLAQCSSVIRDPTKDISSIAMTGDNRQTITDLIDNYASRSLRTIALAYRDFDRWPPKGARTADGDRNEVNFDDIFKQMAFLGVVGIQDPLREGVADAVKTCQKAGVVVRMVTGDNLQTAKAIATECGIYTPGGIIMEGPAFRKLSKTQMDDIILRLQVLARSSPEDKRILVKRLKEKGETVAVTGDGTNDAPALKTADVGFSMGIAGTEVAKEASAIILMDDNFNSIVKAMMWGRTVNDAVKKFLQFQITVNITAVMLTFVSAVASSSESSVLTAVQLLWVNLIMDTMAALALATDPPTPSILDRKPDPKSAPLISITMWKMIIGESIYQLVITFLLYFGSKSILSYQSDREIGQIPTLVFNTFVWMQIFNQWNNRRLDNHFNILEGVTRNWFFLAINLVMIGGQVMIIFVGGKAFNVVHLNGAQWAYSIVLGFLSIPVGAAIRLIPDELLLKLIPDYLWQKPSKGPEVTVSDEEEHFRFPQPLADVKEELAFLKRVKGGRLNNLKFAMQQTRDTFLPRSRSASHSRSNSIPRTPNTEPSREDSFGTSHETPQSRRRSRSTRSRSNSALGATAVMAGIIAGSVAGWSPIEKNHNEDHFRFPRRSDSDHKSDTTTRHEAPIVEPTLSAEPEELEELPAESSNQKPGLDPSPPSSNNAKDL